MASRCAVGPALEVCISRGEGRLCACFGSRGVAVCASDEHTVRIPPRLGKFAHDARERTELAQELPEGGDGEQTVALRVVPAEGGLDPQPFLSRHSTRGELGGDAPTLKK